jgi:hypothetical protein
MIFTLQIKNHKKIGSIMTYDHHKLCRTLEKKCLQNF